MSYQFCLVSGLDHMRLYLSVRDAASVACSCLDANVMGETVTKKVEDLRLLMNKNNIIIHGPVSDNFINLLSSDDKYKPIIWDMVIRRTKPHTGHVTINIDHRSITPHLQNQRLWRFHLLTRHLQEYKKIAIKPTRWEINEMINLSLSDESLTDYLVTNHKEALIFELARRDRPFHLAINDTEASIIAKGYLFGNHIAQFGAVCNYQKSIGNYMNKKDFYDCLWKLAKYGCLDQIKYLLGGGHRGVRWDDIVLGAARCICTFDYQNCSQDVPVDIVKFVTPLCKTRLDIVRILCACIEHGNHKLLEYMLGKHKVNSVQIYTRRCIKYMMSRYNEIVKSIKIAFRLIPNVTIIIRM